MQWQSQGTDAREQLATNIFHKYISQRYFKNIFHLDLQALQFQGSAEYEFVSSF